MEYRRNPAFVKSNAWIEQRKERDLALIRAGIEATKKLVQRKSQSLADEYCHGDSGPAGWTWTNKEAEWQAILLDELAEELDALDERVISEGDEMIRDRDYWKNLAEQRAASGVGEPVAWIWHNSDGTRRSLRWHPDGGPTSSDIIPFSVTPLYAAPTLQREGWQWVPKDIHPLDNSKGGEVIALLMNPPSAQGFDDPNSYYNHWWSLLLKAAAPEHS